MGYDKLIPMMLIPALLLGQNSQLSDAARVLLSKPQVGSAQLTWLGGRKQDGRIVRVTDQFVTFVTNQKPSTSENVDLSKIAAVQWTIRAVGDYTTKYPLGAGRIMCPECQAAAREAGFLEYGPIHFHLHNEGGRIARTI